jgi:hypothetical protein
MGGGFRMNYAKLFKNVCGHLILLFTLIISTLLLVPKIFNTLNIICIIVGIYIFIVLFILLVQGLSKAIYGGE